MPGTATTLKVVEASGIFFRKTPDAGSMQTNIRANKEEFSQN
jgi:hypothetical protein